MWSKILTQLNYQNNMQKNLSSHSNTHSTKIITEIQLKQFKIHTCLEPPIICCCCCCNESNPMWEAAEDEEVGEAAADDVDAARPAEFRPGPPPAPPLDCIKSHKIHHLHYQKNTKIHQNWDHSHCKKIKNSNFEQIKITQKCNNLRISLNSNKNTLFFPPITKFKNSWQQPSFSFSLSNFWHWHQLFSLSRIQNRDFRVQLRKDLSPNLTETIISHGISQFHSQTLRGNLFSIFVFLHQKCFFFWFWDWVKKRVFLLHLFFSDLCCCCLCMRPWNSATNYG